MRHGLWFGLILLNLLFFQNCGDQGFSTENMGSSTLGDDNIYPPGKTLYVDPTLNIQAFDYIENACDNCHSQGGNRYNGFMNLEHLIRTKLIVVGKPEQGRFIGSMYDNSMPPGGPSANSKMLIENWIRSMEWVP